MLPQRLSLQRLFFLLLSACAFVSVHPASVVTITSPENDGVFPEGATLQVTGIANSGAEAISLYENGVLVAHATGSPITSVQFVRQNAGRGDFTLFTVAQLSLGNSVTSAPVTIHVQALFASPVPFNLTFYSVDHAVTNHSAPFVKHYSMDSEPQTDVLLPAMRLVSGPDRRQYYGVWHQKTYVMDSQARVVSEWIPTGAAIPPLSWPMSVTYDTKRDRALLVSFGGEGFLYAYNPHDQSWKVVASMQNRDVKALVYHAPEDALYALATSGQVLYRFTADGAYTGSIPFPPRPAGPDGAFRDELVSVFQNVIWVSEADRSTMQLGRIVQSFVYAINPTNASVRLAFVGAVVNSPALNKALATDVSADPAVAGDQSVGASLSVEGQSARSLLIHTAAAQTLESTPDLGASEWKVVTNAVAGSGGLSVPFDPNATQEFFRARDAQ
jgi:hypothetical protein